MPNLVSVQERFAAGKYFWKFTFDITVWLFDLNIFFCHWHRTSSKSFFLKQEENCPTGITCEYVGLAQREQAFNSFLLILKQLNWCKSSCNDSASNNTLQLFVMYRWRLASAQSLHSFMSKLPIGMWFDIIFSQTRAGCIWWVHT